MERSGRFQESSGEGHAEEGHRSLGSLGFEREEEMEEEGKRREVNRRERRGAGKRESRSQTEY